MKKFLSFFACLVFALSINTTAQTTYHLKKGSNWFSTTVAIDLETLKTALGTSGVSIVSQKDGFLTYESGVWTGSLASFDNAQMYVINVSQDVDVVLNGDKTDSSITLCKGWNWVSGSDMSINEAFQSITPTAGDLIKSFNSFSVYVDYIGWVGDLKSLKDGEGYKYYSNSESEQQVSYFNNHLFSISSTQKVYFSPGNLQYQASTNKWRFAPKQWECIGDDNRNISSSYSGWIDLFCWGTGLNPTARSTYQDVFNDWGKYCELPMPANTTGNWQTMGSYDYLLNQRKTPSNIRYAKAVVNSVPGLIIFPDSWDVTAYTLVSTNNSQADYSSNIISADDWEKVLEKAGCVFLPAAGSAFFTATHTDTYNGLGENGCYWLNYKSSSSNYYAGAFTFSGSSVSAFYGCERSKDSRSSVRLVANVKTVPNHSVAISQNIEAGGTISGGGSYSHGQSVTVTATPKDGYIFINWTENGKIVSRNASYSFSVYNSCNLVANFETSLDKYKISISQNSAVLFSPGNLRYDYHYGSTSKVCYFATYQWDWNPSTNVYDLFKWGYGNDPSNYQTTVSYYPEYRSWEVNVPAPDGTSGWRELSKSQWNYILFERETTSEIRYAKAAVNGVNGLIIVPDSWNPNTYTLNNTNNSGASFDTNIITGKDWLYILEPLGCVFLPCAGSGYDYKTNKDGNSGCYWTTTQTGDYRTESYYVYFGSNDMGIGSYYHYYRYSVRLVSTIK